MGRAPTFCEDHHWGQGEIKELTQVSKPPTMFALATPVLVIAQCQGTVIYVGCRCITVQLQLGLTHDIKKMEILNHKRNYLGRERLMEAKKENTS